MYYKSENLLIRNAEEKDAQLLCNWWNDGKVMAHAGFPNGVGIKPEIIAEQLRKNNEYNNRLILEINDVPVGEMSYRKVAENTAEIGIKICDFTQQEKGFGTKFIKMLIEKLFNEMGFNKIILDTNFSNQRAQHVYEKIGFKKIGVRIDSWKNQLGVLQSCIEYELLKENFIE